MRPPRYAFVRWTDSVMHEDGSEHGLMTGVSLGWVVEDNEDYITLAVDCWEDGEFRTCESIAKTAVEDIRYHEFRK